MPDRRTNLNEVKQSILDADIILTTRVHLNDLREIVGSRKLVLRLDLHLTYGLMNDLAGLTEKKIAVVFLKPSTVRMLGHRVKAMGFQIDLLPVHHKDKKEFVRKISEDRTVMVPPNYLKNVEKVLPRNVRILPIKSVLEEQSVQHLTDVIARPFSRLDPPQAKPSPRSKSSP
jgi:hypothetical protein